MKKISKLKYLTPLFLSSIIPFFPCLGKGIFSVQQIQRLNEPRMEGISDQFLELNVSGDKEKFQRWDGYYDLDGRMYPGDKGGMLFSLKEAYLQRKLGRSRISAGRKIINWNPHEAFWGLGVLNANRGFSYMDYDREGIVALHFQRTAGRFNFHLFGSFVHIPQVNPTFKIRDNRVESINEWSALPFDAVSFNGTRIPINYTLDEPDIANLVLNESIGANLGYSWDTGGVNAYGTYKPENAIRINAAGYYDPDSEAAEVKAKPFTNHHLVWGAQAKQKVLGLDTAVGMEVDHPRIGSDDSFEFEALKIVPTYTKRTYAYGQVQKNFKYAKVGVHFVELLEGEMSEANTFASKSMWQRAGGLSVDWDVTERLNYFFMGKYDITLGDSLMRNQVSYRFGKHISAKAGFEMVRSEDIRSFWTPFKTNDSVYTSLGYIF
ncbi:MAG: hypothetical protein KC493_06845 [Bacteriovoracaceae bacterium]|nr:hypothetical protein [Bacteriovoracaceae bacterium]